MKYEANDIIKKWTQVIKVVVHERFFYGPYSSTGEIKIPATGGRAEKRKPAFPDPARSRCGSCPRGPRWPSW